VILTFFLIISIVDLSFSQDPKDFKNDTFLKKLLIPISRQVLSGDAIVSEPEKVIEKDVIKNIKP